MVSRAAKIANQAGWIRWVALAGIVIAAAIAVFAIVLAVRWPFSRERVLRSLGQTLHANVTARGFRSVYFPHPGCVAEGLKVERATAGQGSAPLATAARMSIEARYRDFVFRPGYIAKIVLDGLQVHLPARGGGEKSGNSKFASGQSGGGDIRVGEIVANHAVLDIDRAQGSKPLDFGVHSLTLHSVGRNTPIRFNAALRSPLPPGEVRGEGQIGPWNQNNAAATPVEGSYAIANASLAAFPSIAGSLSSEGRFGGTLGAIAARGQVRVPDFNATKNHHPVGLSARFDALVNTLNGEVQLRRVDALLGRTQLAVHGSIASASGRRGKTVSVDFVSRRGRIEDVLDLFVQHPPAPISGDAKFHALVRIEPKKSAFLKKVVLQGHFAVENGYFSDGQTQAKVDGLSKRASGDKKKAKPAPQVATTLQGDVLLRNGVAHFTNLLMGVPGSSVRMAGNFNLASESVDFHGTMKTAVNLSAQTHGIKAVLLTPLDPFFKKKHAGAAVPVEMTGTYPNPHYGFNLSAKRKSGQ